MEQTNRSSVFSCLYSTRVCSGSERKKSAKTERKQRLAAELRANLKRRKAKTRNCEPAHRGKAQGNRMDR